MAKKVYKAVRVIEYDDNGDCRYHVQAKKRFVFRTVAEYLHPDNAEHHAKALLKDTHPEPVRRRVVLHHINTQD